MVMATLPATEPRRRSSESGPVPPVRETKPATVASSMWRALAPSPPATEMKPLKRGEVLIETVDVGRGLTGEQKAKPSNGGTSDPEAYQLYLKGRYYWDKRTPETLNKGRDYFQQAVDRDPNYALAYVGLAEYYAVISDYTYVPYSESNPKVKTYATRALAIDDTQAEAHALLAIAYDSDWDWAAATREFERALELSGLNFT